MLGTLIVTGASKGIGRHVCRRAVEKGYRVIGISRSASPVDGCEMLSCDVGDPEQVVRAFETCKRQSDIIGVINAAGIASMNLVFSTPPETMERIVRVNLLGTMYCAREGGKILARQKRGCIINFSTIAVPLAIKGEAVYAGSKGGVEAFSRAFAREMADYGVAVNCIAPGPIDTDLIANVNAARIDEIVARQINPQKAMPEDVWDIVEMLLQANSPMLTGQIFNLGGV